MSDNTFTCRECGDEYSYSERELGRIEVQLDTEQAGNLFFEHKFCLECAVALDYESPRLIALAIEIDVAPGDLDQDSYDETVLTLGQQRYRVLTDEEADEAAKQHCINLVDDCYNIPDKLRSYVDFDRYAEDAIANEGRGFLASHDGHEIECSIWLAGEHWEFYIYRQ